MEEINNSDSNIFVLKGNCDPANISVRIDFITKLFEKAEERILHCDSFRQSNINYALISFAALFALGTQNNDNSIRIVISLSLIILMWFFAIWDRRWHVTKHGWDYSKQIFFKKLMDIINNPNENIKLKSYYSGHEKDEEEKKNKKVKRNKDMKKGEDSAQYFSKLPILYYILILAAIASYYIFNKIAPIK